MIKINGAEVTEAHVEWGVLFEEGDTMYVADGERDARFVAELSEGSKLCARTVYETAWAEVDK